MRLATWEDGAQRLENIYEGYRHYFLTKAAQRDLYARLGQDPKAKRSTGHGRRHWRAAYERKCWQIESTKAQLKQAGMWHAEYEAIIATGLVEVANDG